MIVRPQRLCDELPWEVLTQSEQKSMCDICDDNLTCRDTLSFSDQLKDVPIPFKDPRRRNYCKWGHPLTGDNLIIFPRRELRDCRRCRQIASKKQYQKLLVRKENNLNMIEEDTGKIKLYSVRRSLTTAMRWDGTVSGFHPIADVVLDLGGDTLYLDPTPRRETLQSSVPASLQKIKVELNGSRVYIEPNQYILFRYDLGPMVLTDREFESLYEPVIVHGFETNDIPKQNVSNLLKRIHKSVKFLRSLS